MMQGIPRKIRGNTYTLSILVSLETTENDVTKERSE